MTVIGLKVKIKILMGMFALYNWLILEKRYTAHFRLARGLFIFILKT